MSSTVALVVSRSFVTLASINAVHESLHDGHVVSRLIMEENIYNALCYSVPGLDFLLDLSDNTWSELFKDVDVRVFVDERPVEIEHEQGSCLFCGHCGCLIYRMYV